jgi:hypothetical protein
MANNLTVLYYSANSEDPVFEKNTRKILLENIGNLPLVSVTQEPALNLGQNICVGKHYACYGNEFRQIQIGLRAVKTEYVIVAEADTLYPPEYFNFEPQGGNCYRYGNVWFSYVRPGDVKPRKAIYKKYSDCAQIMKKDFWLKIIESAIGSDENHWFSEQDKPNTTTPRTDQELIWESQNPVITFKTINNVSRFTSRVHKVDSALVLPYWGDIGELRKKLSIY